MDGQTPRKSWKRRLVRALALGLIVAAAALVALPWVLGLPPVRAGLVARVNQALAPSKVTVRGVSASWVSPIRLTGVTLKNAKGKTLVDAKQAVVEHSLLSLLLSPHRVGTVVLEGAALDIERRADGSIDLVDALMPPNPNPTPPKAVAATEHPGGRSFSVSLRVLGGSLKLTSPELAEPLVAAKLDMEATLPEDEGQVLAWRIRLAAPPGGTEAETLGIDGSYDHRAATDANLSLAVKGERWPLAVNGAALGAAAAVRARLDGVLTVDRKSGHWETAGDSRLLGLDASGAALGGDRLKLDLVAAGWNVFQSAGGWELRKLDLKSTVAEAHAGGTVGPGGTAPTAHLDATVDLAALAKQVPHALRLKEGLTLERGSAGVSATLRSEGTTQTASLDAKLSDLVARDATHAITMRDPVTVSARGAKTATGFRLDAMVLKAAFADLNGSGDLERGVTLSGRVDLGAFQAQFRELIDFGAVGLAGQGRLAADYRKGDKGYVARAAVEVKGLKVAGLTAEPIVRDSARLDAVAGGPFNASGLPLGFDGARVNLKSSRDAVSLAATRKDGTVAVNATASTPWTVYEREGQVEARVVGRWSQGSLPGGGEFEFDELRLGLKPTDPSLAADGTLALAVRGRVNLGTEDVALTPLPSPAGAALSLAPEGMTLHGWSKTPAVGRAARVAIRGDAGAIDRAAAVWMKQPAYGLAGAVSVLAVSRPEGPDRLAFALSVQSPDLSRARSDGKGRQPEGPLAVACRGTYQSAGDRAVVDELDVVTRYASLTATGRVDEPGGRRAADLQGTLTPNWQTITAVAAELVEPKMRLEGGPRPFRVKGPLSGASLASFLKGLDAEVGVNLASADAFGLKLGPAPLVIHCGGGAVTLDPIHTTLNEGRVDLIPGLDVDDVKGIALRLAKGSAVENAAINDEVSGRVLRYVAPVLDKATHVNGKVSLLVDDGDIPLTGPPEHKLSLTGKLVFQDVVFAPGPFASELLTLTGRSDSPGLKLHQPVQLAVANGRVTQKGLEIPVRKDATVAIDGSVGFDQTLDLKASVPITRGMIGPVPGLDGLVDGRHVIVPIGGTVEHPTINRQALQVALKQLSKDVLKRGLSQQATGLLDQLAPPAAGAPGAGAGAPADPAKRIEDEVLRRLMPKRPANRQP